jgi:hypothetical protein
LPVIPVLLRTLESWLPENNPHYRKTYEALHGAGLSDAQIMDTVVRNYEAPARPDADIQYRLRLLRGLPTLTGTDCKSAEMHRGGALARAIRTAASTGGQPQAVTPEMHRGGDHTVNIHVTAPDGTKVSTSDTGLFHRKTIHRHRMSTRQLLQ